MPHDKIRSGLVPGALVVAALIIETVHGTTVDQPELIK